MITAAVIGALTATISYTAINKAIEKYEFKKYQEALRRAWQEEADRIAAESEPNVAHLRVMN